MITPASPTETPMLAALTALLIGTALLVIATRMKAHLPDGATLTARPTLTATTLLTAGAGLAVVLAALVRALVALAELVV